MCAPKRSKLLDSSGVGPDPADYQVGIGSSAAQKMCVAAAELVLLTRRIATLPDLEDARHVHHLSYMNERPRGDIVLVNQVHVPGDPALLALLLKGRR